MSADGTESGTQNVLKKSETGSSPSATVSPDSQASFLSKEADEPALRAGKDEMNLAEYPFALLRHKGNKDRSVIEIDHEHRHHKTGEIMQAHWRVEGSAEFGLPGPMEERLYLVLMELTREQGMAQEVYFSRYDLLKRLGWPDNPRCYQQLRECFIRLKAVNITADNAFWCPSIQSYYKTVGFNLLDEFRLAEEPKGRHAQGQKPMSSFRWHNIIYTSLQEGYVRAIDAGFALSLDLPLALRLFRYLDKHRRGKDGAARASFEIGLQRLCEVHLGMAPTPYPSVHKQRLEPAHEELMRRNFLNGVQYEKMKTRDGLKVTYSFTSSAGAATPDSLPPLLAPTLVPVAPVQIAPPPAKTRAAETRLEWLRRTTGLEDMALRELCREVFTKLPDDLQDKLRTEARKSVASFAWERLEEPESPISLALWELIAVDYPNELDLALHHALAQPDAPKAKRGLRKQPRSKRPQSN
jgi:Replication initiator protein A